MSEEGLKKGEERCAVHRYPCSGGTLIVHVARTLRASADSAGPGSPKAPHCLVVE
jgi:hypothetical protein